MGAFLKNKTLYFASLGCSKNLVDSQVMLGRLKLEGLKLVDVPAEAGVIVINTCSFIEDAKKESIDTILDLVDYKNPAKGMCQILIVAGCLPQRYAEELQNELPEVDLFIGTGEYHRIATFIRDIEAGNLKSRIVVDVPLFIHTEEDPRINTSSPWMAWLKVSEGCDRKCTFCVIPKIRGPLRSRTVESLHKEAEALVKSGVKELNIISQDLSSYGKDLGGMNTLPRLLESLETIKNLEWIRLFYHYPEDLSEKFMSVLAKSRKICAYLDMPVQHFSDSILKKMNRKTTGVEIVQKIRDLKKAVPNIALRTSLIVGFPGETEEDFETLLTGIKQMRFDHLGVFKYSDEEGTPAFKLPGKIDKKTIQRRFKKVYDLQKSIVRENNKDFLGKTLRVLIEGLHEETELLLQGRHAGQAPDIDGKVIVNEGFARPGEFVNVEITEILDHDLLGRIISP
jgi:ribosomal protein S12 methylthiotransferase